MSDSKERLDYAGLSRFKDNLLDDVYAHVSKKDEAFDNIKTDIFDSIYPVGSIYMSINETSPASLFGGEWTQIKDTFLLAAGDTYTSGETGGEATHTLSVSEMPSHSHTINSHTHSIPELSGTAASAGSHSHTMNTHSHTYGTLAGTAASAGSHSHNIRANGYTLASGSSSLELPFQDGPDEYSRVIVSAGSHTHSVSMSGSTGNGSSTINANGSHTHSITTNSATSGSTTATMGTTGSDSAHNNMPPYLTVYMWQRIA